MTDHGAKDFLHHQVQGYLDTREPAFLLSPQTAMARSDLHDTLRRHFARGGQPEEVVEELRVLGWALYCLAELKIEDATFQAAATLLAPVYRISPAMVPPALRRAWDEASAEDPRTTRRRMVYQVLLRAAGSRDVELLGKSVELLTRLTDESGPADPDHAMEVAELADALWQLHLLANDMDALAESVKRFRQALGRRPFDSGRFPGDARAAVLGTFCQAAGALYLHRGEAAALEEAIAAGEDCLTCAAAGDEFIGRYRSVLGNAYRSRFMLFGSKPDAVKAIGHGREAVRVTSADDPNLGVRKSNLGSSLLAAYKQDGDEALLAEAIGQWREVMEALPTDAPNPGMVYSNLGSALTHRFGADPDLAVLDEAIALHREAISRTDPHHPDLSLYLSNLGASLLHRSTFLRDAGDARRSVEAHQRAMALIPTAHPDFPQRLGGLLAALDEYASTEDGREDASVSATLRDALARMRETAALSPAGRPGLAQELQLAARVLDRIGGDVDEVLGLSRAALAASHPDDPDRPAYEYTVGLALWTKYAAQPEADAQRTEAARDEALEHLRAAWRVRAGLRSRFLTQLGARLWDAAREAGDPSLMRESERTLEEVRATASTPPAVRYSVTTVLGTQYADAANWDAADGAFSDAIRTLSHTVPRRLERKDQERLLAGLPGVCSDAAACALNTGAPERAFGLLEQGRSVLAAQVLDTRGEIAEVRRRSPGLADRLEAVRTALGEPAEPDGEARIVTLTARLEEVTAEIRTLEGLADFPRLSDADLRATAARGPVVTVNISSYRSDAFVYTASGLEEVVPLPHATRGDINRLYADFQEALALATRDTSAEEAERGETLIDGVLRRLWDGVAGPVLDAVAGLRPDDPAEPRRLWWSPTGLLSFLPLHAAGHHEERGTHGARTVLDRVVSSYTPTMRGLREAQHRLARADTSLNGAVVALPDTGVPWIGTLPGVDEEVEILTRGFTGVDVLRGADATRGNVVEALKGHGWMHFACHGVSDPDAPSSGALLLHRAQPLGVTDIAALSIDGAGLAFLAACNTARGGNDLADESIHLASAFLLAGYPQVVGSLWPLGDAAAPVVTGCAYGPVSGAARGPDLREVPFGVHEAALRLRAAYPHRPSIWAAHLHVGA
ncbi:MULTISPECIES: CHAT domain-containing protein [unclassified Streptomyces]|uniref:CHAT domain-containing protein n=1 Tax=unclassified Streptomyces TaxID=2593676 RepID=UPI0033310A7C